MAMTARRILGWALALVVAGSCAEGTALQQSASTTSGGPGGQGGEAGATSTGSTGGTGGTEGTGGNANPCDGITCNTPPMNTCADAQNLTVFSPTGICDGGQCSYTPSTVPCPNGCAGGACSGDPCVGISCVTPPPKACADATYLTVYDTPGTCNAGTCEYASHQEFCQNGCSNDACAGDPCIGVTCTTPQANYCSGPNDLVVFDIPGTCMAGACQYTNHVEYCAFGCVNGACSGDPCVGVTCMTPPAAYCLNASVLRTFASSGSCMGGACTYPAMDQQCASGCLNGKCLDCTTSADCASGNWCNANSCVSCNDNQHCGASCTACGSPTPHCLDQGMASTCVECLNNTHCTSPAVCTANTCGAGCPLPADACTTGTQDRKGCANARIIGRSTAGTPAGYTASPTTCTSTNLMDASSCSDSGKDHTYRVFLRQGESMTATLSTGSNCVGGTWFATLKFYTNSGCTSTQCTTTALCDANKSNTTKTHVATQDGWYIIAVDGATNNSDEGVYTLNVKITCNAGTCEC